MNIFLRLFNIDYKKSYIINKIKYLIGIAVITILIYHIQSKENILPVLFYFNINKLFPATFLLILHLSVLFFMWSYIVKVIGQINPPFKLVFHSFFGGRALALITPGHLGELLKGMFFEHSERLQGTSASILYSLYNTFIRTIMGVISYIYLYNKFKSINLNFNYFHIILTVLFIIILFISVFKLVLKNNILKDITNLFKLVKTQLITTSYINVILLIIFALIANILSALIFLIILSGFDIIKISFDGFMAFEAAYFTMSLLPITPSGIGIREGSRVYFFALLGCNKAAVLSASFIVFGLNIGLPALIGLTSLRYLLYKNSKI